MNGQVIQFPSVNGQVIQFPSRPSRPEVFLSRRQLADLIGMSERWIDYRRRDGMPSYRFGSRRKFKLSEVQPWIASWQAGRDAA